MLVCVGMSLGVLVCLFVRIVFVSVFVVSFKHRVRMIACFVVFVLCICVCLLFVCVYCVCVCVCVVLCVCLCFFCYCFVSLVFLFGVCEYFVFFLVGLFDCLVCYVFSSVFVLC